MLSDSYKTLQRSLMPLPSGIDDNLYSHQKSAKQAADNKPLRSIADIIRKLTVFVHSWICLLIIYYCSKNVFDFAVECWEIHQSIPYSWDKLKEVTSGIHFRSTLPSSTLFDLRLHRGSGRLWGIFWMSSICSPSHHSSLSLCLLLYVL